MDSDTVPLLEINNFKSIILLLTAMMLFSCKNDFKGSSFIYEVDTLPSQIAKDIEVYYSERGKTQVILKAPVMAKEEGEEPYLEFPQGFDIKFFDKDMGMKSQISAKYGINYEKDEIFEARDSVVVYNKEKEQKVYTNHLSWERKKKIIYSYEKVRIVTPDDIIIGDTLISDENFEDYTLKHISAEISVEDENEIQ